MTPLFANLPTSTQGPTSVVILEHGDLGFMKAAQFTEETATSMSPFSDAFQRYSTPGPAAVKALHFDELTGPHNSGLRFDFGGRGGYRFAYSHSISSSVASIVLLDSRNIHTSIDNMVADLGEISDFLRFFRQMKASPCLLAIATHQDSPDAMPLAEIGDALQLAGSNSSFASMAVFGCSGAGFTETTKGAVEWSASMLAAFEWLAQEARASEAQHAATMQQSKFGNNKRGRKAPSTAPPASSAGALSIWGKISQLWGRKKEAEADGPSASSTVRGVTLSKYLLYRGAPLKTLDTADSFVDLRSAERAVKPKAGDAAAPAESKPADVEESALHGLVPASEPTLAAAESDGDDRTLSSSMASEVSSLNESMLPSDEEEEEEEEAAVSSPGLSVGILVDI